MSNEVLFTFPRAELPASNHIAAPSLVSCVWQHAIASVILASDRVTGQGELGVKTSSVSVVQEKKHYDFLASKRQVQIMLHLPDGGTQKQP